MEIGSVDSVDIAALSIEMNEAKVQQQVDVAVLKMELDTATETSEMMTQLIASGSAGGGHIDISV